MSPRILQYGHYDVHFSCREGDRYANAANSPELTPATVNNKRSAALRSIFKTDSLNISNPWRLILHNYTSRTLKHQTDRIVAISGIANLFSSRTNDVYLAGIWKNDLAAGLTWRVARTRRLNGGSAKSPSWSWAITDMNYTSFWIDNHPDSTPDPQFNLVSHNTVLAEPAALFGDVIICQLRIKGLVKRVWHDGTDLLRSDTYIGGGFIVCLDLPENETRRPCEVVCLQIYHFDEDTTIHHHEPAGLVLEQNGDTFRRIGLFKFDYRPPSIGPTNASEYYERTLIEKKEWATNYELQEIVIE